MIKPNKAHLYSMFYHVLLITNRFRSFCYHHHQSGFTGVLRIQRGGGGALAQWLGAVLQIGRSLVRSQMVSVEFSLT